MSKEAIIRLLINNTMSFEIKDTFDPVSNLGICDLDGKVVYKKLINFKEIDTQPDNLVDGLQPGEYYIVIHGLHRMITRKLIVN